MNSCLKTRNKNIIVKLLVVILLVNCVLFLISSTKEITAQEKDRTLYFKRVDKTHYYVRFVNEIPYFLINRYNFYYEVTFRKNGDKIKEVSVFDNEREIEKWLYGYPEPGIITINYNKVQMPESAENESDSEHNGYTALGEEVRTILIPTEKDVFYYDMGKLVKGENYSADGTLNFYYNIKYNGNRITNEYYYRSDDSFMYKYYNYNNQNNLSHILRRGVIKNKNANNPENLAHENKDLNITEKWLYDNHRLSSVEKYDRASLKEKFYFNEYGFVTKKEIFNNVLRITYFYIYKYDKDLNLINIKQYRAVDPFRSIPKESILIEEYTLEEDNRLIGKKYVDSSISEEEIISYPEKTITKIDYHKNGDITNIEYISIIDEISRKFYAENEENTLVKETKVDIYNKIRKDIQYDDEGNVSKAESKIIETDKYVLDGEYNPIEDEKDKLGKKIIINFKEKTINEIQYDDKENIKNNVKSKVIPDFETYLSYLKLKPNSEIILFAPDNRVTFNRQN